MMFDFIPRRQVSYIGALTPSPTPHSQHKYYYAAYRLNIHFGEASLSNKGFLLPPSMLYMTLI
jgi:hypothetical protein